MDWILAIALCIISAFVGLTTGYFVNRNKNIHKSPCENFNLYKSDTESFKTGFLEKLAIQNKKIEEMEKRLDAGDERFNSIEKTNIKLENKIDRIKEMLEIILTTVKNFSTFQEQITNKLSANKNV